MSPDEFPSTVPICTDEDTASAERTTAKKSGRPFVAVIDEDETPGWKAAYSMDEAGEDKEDWYLLREEAVGELEEIHSQYQQNAELYSFNDGCSHKSGSLHGLSKEDARELAEQFAEIVWNQDNWKPYDSKEVFLSSS